MKQFLIALDQIINTLAGGYADETISARAWRWSQSGQRDWPRFLIDTLFWPLERDHCKSAYAAEIARKQLPKGYR